MNGRFLLTCDCGRTVADLTNGCSLWARTIADRTNGCSLLARIIADLTHGCSLLARRAQTGATAVARAAPGLRGMGGWA